MKRFTCFLLAAAGFSPVTNAQITKGSTFLGGSISAGSSKVSSDVNSNDYTKNSAWSISPQFGKAIKENTILGVSLVYGRQDFTQAYTGGMYKFNEKTYGINALYRKYFPIGQRFYLFGEGLLGYSFSNNDRTQNIYQPYFKYDQSLIGASITPGISFAASRKLFLETSLNSLFYANYSWYKTFINTGSSQSSPASAKEFGIGVNSNAFSSINVGLRWILPGKTK